MVAQEGDKGDAKGDAKVIDKKQLDKENELSEEDVKLQTELNMLVERFQEGRPDLQKPALESLRTLIRSSTTSMTSVPKPLKFLRPHFGTMKDVFDKITDPEVKRTCASVLSVMAMTMSTTRESIKYKLMGTEEDIGSWGHEYVRHLAGELTQDWNEAVELDKGRQTVLLALARQLVTYFMQHNAEPEACDLLMEIEQLALLEEFVDAHAYNKVCLYLVSCVPYVADPEDTQLLKTAIKLYHKFNQYTEAVRLAIRLNDLTLIKELFLLCPDRSTKMQIAFILAHSQVYLELDEQSDGYDELMEIMSNSRLNAYHLQLARELDIAEPKNPEDVYKSHLEQHRTLYPGTGLDSARQNLASAFVNGFLNCAFGTDKMFAEDGNKWIYKNKEHGMLSATASLGLLFLWDVDGGLTQIDKYTHSTDEYIKSGAFLACGIVNARIRNECDPAKALLAEHVLSKSNIIRTGAIIGLSLAYAGTNRADVIELLLPVLEDENSTLEIKCFTAVSLGLIAVGSCNAQIAEAILQCLMERTSLELKDALAKLLALGLGLLHLGEQERVETVRATLQVLEDPYKTVAIHFVDACAYAGTGNVLKVQQFLHTCSEHLETPTKEDEDKKKDEKKEEKDGGDKDKEKEKKKDDATDAGMQQAVAAIGIALIAMGEDIGSEMSLRSFGHLLRYGDPALRRAVPLALSLLSVSNPKLNVMDTLSKFSHDNDSEVASNSVLAMGIIGAGTNNARLATMLRNLAVYHTKDANSLFMVRIAQGLLHMGKGTHSLSPQYSDRFLVSRASLAGLLIVLTACLDTKSTILGKHHYLLYYLVPAIQSRMLVCFDEDLTAITTSVRVGTAVDIVGQAGRPKAITGFQTHTTPVLMNYGERAELATEDYVPLTSVLEGFVVLRKRATDHDMA